MPLVVAKIGGSVLTDKQDFCTPRPRVITRLADEISTALATEPKLGLALVHGVGSYGHAPFKKYRLESKKYSRKEWMGFSFTRWACNELNQKVIEALLEHDVPAIGVEGVGHMPTPTAETDIFSISSIKRALEEGLVPVLHGNMAFGLPGQNPASAFSGDTKLAMLAGELNPQRIVIGTDVDGIYDCDPKVPGAKLLADIKYAQLPKLMPKMGTANHDATGGMKGKVSELLKIKRQGLKVTVVNALEEGRFCSALLNKPTIGTLIE